MSKLRSSPVVRLEIKQIPEFPKKELIENNLATKQDALALRKELEHFKKYLTNKTH
jgi:hypothetical protein